MSIKNNSKTITEGAIMQLHATPYGYYDNYGGFYFDSLDQYQQHYDAALAVHGCEEYEIQFIDGTDSEMELFNAVKVNQANLGDYFDLVDAIGADDMKVIAFKYLADCGYALGGIKDRLDDVCVFEGSVKDYAMELADECYLSDAPEIFQRYFDYDSFARDLELGGDVCDMGGYVITNANEF